MKATQQYELQYQQDDAGKVWEDSAFNEPGKSLAALRKIKKARSQPQRYRIVRVTKKILK